MCIERRDPYTGHIYGVTAPDPGPFTPQEWAHIDARLRELIREELSNHLALSSSHSSSKRLRWTMAESPPSAPCR